MPIIPLTVNNYLLENQLAKLHNTLLQEIKAVSNPSELPKLAFIAIDNDILCKVEFIKNQVMKKGFIPIIGESCLGTYLVTNHYGKKEPILRDCLSLIDLCDEFFVVIDAPSLVRDEIIDTIPEGVLFEVRYWQMTRPSAAITVYNINSSILMEVFKLSSSYPLFTRSKTFNDEVEAALICQIPQKQKSRYIAIAPRDAKHVDWLRISALNNQQVPVCPYNIISIGALLVAFNGVSEVQIIKYYASIALKCQEIYVHAAIPHEQVTQEKLDYHILFLLFLTNRLKQITETTIYYQSFYELDIPKFTHPKMWKVTQKETQRVIDASLSTKINQSYSLLEHGAQKKFSFFATSSNLDGQSTLIKNSLTAKL